MSTVALYTPNPANPDGWHHVISPGGYEWWYFDAEDLEQDIQVVAILFDGFVFHPGYLRRYSRYLRHPTRVVPPVAGDFPCAYSAIYRGGKLLGQFMTQYSPTEMDRSSDHGPRMGDCRMDRDSSGAIRLLMKGTPWTLTARGPQVMAGDALEARLRFEPLIDAAPLERVFLSRRLSGAEHRWVLANPLCSVEGECVFGGETIHIRARGYHDHNYGTAPIGPGLRRWIWGRVLFDDEAFTFHFARARDRRLSDEVHLLRADRAGIAELPVRSLKCDWSRSTALHLHYPDALQMGQELELSNPRVIDPSPFYMRLMYDAVCRGRTGKAFCEVAYPHRLRWPVLGRMIEMSIDRRGLLSHASAR